jgi:histidinol-phosphate aminotransferase
MSFDPTALIRPEVRALFAYHPGPGAAPGQRLVKLDANESPFGLGEALRGALAAELSRALTDVELHRYPDPGARELRAALAGELGVEPEQVLATNGSDEGIQLLLLATAVPGGAVLAPAPTFVMYELGARALGLRYVGVPLDAGYGLDLDGFLAALERERPRLVFLAWPNNPTGGLVTDEAGIEQILRACAGDACQALVVVDEAYYHYAGCTILPRLGEFPNLVVLRTLSKIGLAGIRLGMLVASAALATEINKVRPPYNVNALSQAAARVVLRHGEVVRRQAAAVVAERERLLRALAPLPGVATFPSAANFLLLRTARSSDLVHRELLARGIVVRNFGRLPHLTNCLRVTVGTAEENEAFLAALAEVLREA